MIPQIPEVIQPIIVEKLSQSIISRFGSAKNQVETSEPPIIDSLMQDYAYMY